MPPPFRPIRAQVVDRIHDADRAGDPGAACLAILWGWRESQADACGFWVRGNSFHRSLQRRLTPATRAWTEWEVVLTASVQRALGPPPDLRAAFDAAILAGLLRDPQARTQAEVVLNGAAALEWTAAFGPPAASIRLFRGHRLLHASARHLGPVASIIEHLDAALTRSAPGLEDAAGRAFDLLPIETRDLLGARLRKRLGDSVDQSLTPSFHATPLIDGLVAVGRYADAWGVVASVVRRGDGDRLLGLLADLCARYPLFLAARPSEAPGG